MFALSSSDILGIHRVGLNKIISVTNRVCHMHALIKAPLPHDFVPKKNDRMAELVKAAPVAAPKAAARQPSAEPAKKAILDPLGLFK